MDIRDYLNLMHTAERLKKNTRHSWLSDGRRESVAEHSWRLLMMAYFVKDEFPEANMERVMLMAAFHDIGEAFTGDIPAFSKTEEDRTEEGRRIRQWLDTLPETYRTELYGLFDEMDAMQTLEARLCKALDKLEALIQHNEADLFTWLPLERELNRTYANEYVAFSGYLKALRREILVNTLEKLGELANQ